MTEPPADAPAPALGIDPRLVVRQLPHDQRHARVLEALPGGGALVLVAPHTHPARCWPRSQPASATAYSASGCRTGRDVWQIRLSRQPAAI
ncbi:DUF2249 domain-containing protein [Micromonospora tulbaghiae]|uniref:DUF2249 domain-containing protein n=1 Tax=Micromonospora tulbaghiae TaxID=479978 RepID=UPI0033D339AA